MTAVTSGIAIRGAQLQVRVGGDHGTALVWAHGLMSSMEAEDALDWFGWHQMPAPIRLVRYDARGHGQSAAAHQADGYTWNNLALDMLAVADAAGAGRFIAGGTSMGCATALHAALIAPERVKALVLAMPPTIWEARAPQRRLYQRAALLGGVLGARLMGRLMQRDMGRTMPPWLVEAAPGMAGAAALGMRALSRKTMADLFHGAGMSDLPPRAALAALADTPALIVGWDGDPVHPLWSAQELQRLLPRSELFVAQSYAGFATVGARLKQFAVAHA